MSRPSQLIVLCEDKLHDVCVCRFLKQRYGLSHRAIRTIPFPHGLGCGSQHVREKLPDELRALRSRNAKSILVVVVDADDRTVQERKNELDQRCRASELPPRQDREPVVYVIPKWAMTAWLRWLDDRVIDESKAGDLSRYNFGGCERETRPHVDRLVEMCRESRLDSPAPPSLEEACTEFERVSVFFQ